MRVCATFRVGSNKGPNMLSWVVPMSNADTIYIVTINCAGTVLTLVKSISSFVLVAYDLATHVSVFNTMDLKHCR